MCSIPLRSQDLLFSFQFHLKHHHPLLTPPRGAHSDRTRVLCGLVETYWLYRFHTHFHKHTHNPASSSSCCKSIEVRHTELRITLRHREVLQRAPISGTCRSIASLALVATTWMSNWITSLRWHRHALIHWHIVHITKCWCAPKANRIIAHNIFGWLYAMARRNFGRFRSNEEMKCRRFGLTVYIGCWISEN